MGGKQARAAVLEFTRQVMAGPPAQLAGFRDRADVCHACVAVTQQSEEGSRKGIQVTNSIRACRVGRNNTSRAAVLTKKVQASRQLTGKVG